VPTDSTYSGLVVLVDDEELALLTMEELLVAKGYEVRSFTSAVTALAWPSLEAADAIVTDVRMDEMDGEQFLAALAPRELEAPVVVVSGHANVAMAVRCLKNGAYTFQEKPLKIDLFLAAVGRAVEKAKLRKEARELRERLRELSRDQDGRLGMIGKCRAILDMYEKISVVAPSLAPVLIYGETGTGKELVARAIHDSSPRSDGPFVAVNAGALPEAIMESELFGHTRGAFTGAQSARDGKILASSGGTLFLDEIECISLAAQVRLLRVLEENAVYPLGSDAPRKVDLRLVAATNEDLRQLIDSGKMREDFYHRVAVFPIRVPPLRERTSDIPLLVAHFLRQAASRLGCEVPEFPAETLGQLSRYPWPGNVRELRNAIERMVISARDGRVGPFLEVDEEPPRHVSVPGTPGLLRSEMERIEEGVIRTTLEANRGEVMETAEALGISRRALYDRLKKYGIDRNDFRA